MTIGIRSRLLAGFGLLLAMMAGLGLASHGVNQSLWRQFESLYRENVMSSVQLAGAAEALWQLRYGFPQFLVVGAEERAKIVAEQPKWKAQIAEAFAAYGKSPRTAEERQALAEWTDAFDKYMAARPRWFELVAAGKMEEAAEWRARTTTPYGRASVAALGRLIQLQKEVGARREQEARAMAERATVVMVVLVVASLAAGMAFAWYVARSITAPLRKLARAANRISEGRIPAEGVQLQTQDEFGRLGAVFDGMTAALRDILSRAQEASRRLDASSRDLLAANRQLSEGTQSQARRLAEVSGETSRRAAALEELSATFSTVSQRSSENAAAAEEGRRAVAESSHGLDGIRAASAEAEQTLQRMAQASERIGSIVVAIQEIAGETHVLSLNASIEASRAGEAGRGFAVVANEVRALAERAAQSAREIRDIVAGIYQELRNAQEAVQRNVAAVASGVASGAVLSRTFEEIQRSARDTHGSVSEVTSVLRDQVDGTRRTAALVEEVARVAGGSLSASALIVGQGDELRVVISNLDQILGRFELEQSTPDRSARPPAPDLPTGHGTWDIRPDPG
jgi:methyl-accepting chemotaxis protein